MPTKTIPLQLNFIHMRCFTILTDPFHWPTLSGRLKRKPVLSDPLAVINFLMLTALLGVQTLMNIVHKPLLLFSFTASIFVSCLNADILSAQQTALEPVVSLTDEERAWLEQKHTVRVFSTNHAPLLFYKGGKPFGPAVDLLNEVSKRTGVKFDIAEPLRDFPSAMKGLIENEGPDVMAGLNPTPEREKVILFTKPYVTSPKFIFTQDNAPFVSSMANLSGKTVAVI